MGDGKPAQDADEAIPNPEESASVEEVPSAESPADYVEGEEDVPEGDGEVPDEMDRIHDKAKEVVDKPPLENAMKVTPFVNHLEADSGVAGEFIRARKAEWDGMSLYQQKDKLRLHRGVCGEILAFLASSSIVTKLPYAWGDIQESMYATLLYCGMTEFKLDEVPQEEWDALRKQVSKEEGRIIGEEELRFLMNEKMIEEGPYKKDKGREFGANVLLTIGGWLAKADPQTLALLAMAKPVLAGKAYSRDVATEVRHIRKDPAKKYEDAREVMTARTEKVAA
jgi:hypothetical protein